MPETIDSANAAASTLFLGHNGEWWDFWLIVSVVIAALSAIAIGVTTTGSIVSHKREASAAQEALERFKLTTEEKISDANAKALEARLELEKYKAPRTLTAEQLKSMADAMRRHSGQEYQLMTFWDLKEPTALSNLLLQALKMAEWKLVPVPAGTILIGRMTGVQLLLYPQADAHTKSSAAALLTMLKLLGLEASLKSEYGDGPQDNMIHINVGTKQ